MKFLFVPLSLFLCAMIQRPWNSVKYRLRTEKQIFQYLLLLQSTPKIQISKYQTSANFFGKLLLHLTLTMNSIVPLWFMVRKNHIFGHISLFLFLFFTLASIQDHQFPHHYCHRRNSISFCWKKKKTRVWRDAEWEERENQNIEYWHSYTRTTCAVSSSQSSPPSSRPSSRRCCLWRLPMTPRILFFFPIPFFFFFFFGLHRQGDNTLKIIYTGYLRR